MPAVPARLMIIGPDGEETVALSKPRFTIGRHSGNDLKLSAPRFGVILNAAGLALPDGTRQGLSALDGRSSESRGAVLAAGWK